MEGFERKKTKKRLALIILICVIFNIFSPFILLRSEVFAQTPFPLPDKVIVFKRGSDVKTIGSNIKYFELHISTRKIASWGFDINFSYDKSVIVPMNRSTGAVLTNAAQFGTIGITNQNSGVFNANFSADLNAGTLRVTPYTTFPMPVDDISLSGDGDYHAFTIPFRFVDQDNASIDMLTTSLFNLVPVAGSLPNGLKFGYEDNADYWMTYEPGYEVVSQDVSKWGLEGFVQVEPSRTITNVAITTNPTTSYEHGDNISLAGGKITVTYDSGDPDIIDMDTDADVTFTPITANYNQTVPGTQTVNLKYKAYDLSYNITVTDPINKLEFINQPTKLEYNDKDTPIVLDGATLRTTTKSGATTDINAPYTGLTWDNQADITKAIDRWQVDAGQLTAGNQEITVTHTASGKTAKMTIVVNDTINNIAVNNTTYGEIKTDYLYGEEFSRSTGGITVTTSGGGLFNLPLSDGGITLSGYNKNILTPPNQTVTVGYLDKTTTITNVTVSDYVDSIKINLPNKTYNYGEELNLTGATVTQVMKSGVDGSSTALTAGMITGYDKETIGSQPLTISNWGKDTTETVTVNDIPVGLSITGFNKTTYKWNEELDLSTARVSVLMASGSTAANTPLLSSMITGYEKTPTYAVGETSKAQELTVTYNGQTGTLDITTINDLTGISVTTNPKTTYNYTDSLSVAGGKITATRASGATEEIDITNTMVTGYPPTFNAGEIVKTVPLTVTYTEHGITRTDTYDVTVTNQLSNISIKTQPTKLSYVEGQSLALEGLEIRLTYDSGWSEDVEFADFTAKGITTSLENGTALTVLDHNGQTIEMSTNGKSANTNQLSVVEKRVKIIEMLTEPDKMEYVEGETLDLTGMTVKITYNDDTVVTVAAENFGTKGISTNIAHGATLTVSAHNGIAIVVSCNGVGDITLTDVTVNKLEVEALNGTIEGEMVTINAKGHVATIIAVKSEDDVDWESDGGTSGYRELNGELTTEFQNLIVGTTQSNIDGTFSLSLPKGTYDILIDKPGYLDYIMITIEVKAGEITEMSDEIIELLAGDIGKDGYIYSQDIVAIKGVYNIDETSGSYEDKFDLNGDTYVYSQDIVAVKTNYGKVKQVYVYEGGV